MAHIEEQQEVFRRALYKAEFGRTALLEQEAHADRPESPSQLPSKNLLPSSSNWPILDEAAYTGVAGTFTKSVAPYSEADPAGILLHTVIGCGSVIGAGPHILVEQTPHYARLNALLVGKTSGGRKGTAWGVPRYLMAHVDELWVRSRVKSGLSSGEGLIYQVRDSRTERVPIKKGGRCTGEFDEELVDEGEKDKRLLIIESEFATTLKVMEREGNTLSPVLRDAWDHGNLSPLTKRDRIAATGAHVCVIGHITAEELLRYLTVTERGNGFANRFLFALVKRAQFLPAGKGAPTALLESHFLPFLRTIHVAQTRGELTRDPKCETLWAKMYPTLEEDIPGLTGAILGRGAAQVLRLSLVYSLLDPKESERQNPAIRVPHLLAALAIWDYCQASVFHIFGDAIGDPAADRLLRAIKRGPQTDTDLYELLGKHGRDGARKEQALDLLQQLNRVHFVRIPTGGRYIREWHSGIVKGCAICAKRVESPQ